MLQKGQEHLSLYDGWLPHIRQKHDIIICNLYTGKAIRMAAE